MTMLVPDLVEPIVGWRAWVAEPTYSKQGRLTLCLNSLYYALHWPQGRPVRARCEHGDAAPCGDDSHLCGVHAAHTLEGAVRYLPERLREPRGWYSRPTQVVLGTVAMWGDVVEHEDGYRAAEAYPLELYVPSIFKVRGTDIYAGEARDLLDAYDARVHVFRHWNDLAPAVAA